MWKVCRDARKSQYPTAHPGTVSMHKAWIQVRTSTYGSKRHVRHSHRTTTQAVEQLRFCKGHPQHCHELSIHRSRQSKRKVSRAALVDQKQLNTVTKSTDFVYALTLLTSLRVKPKQSCRPQSYHDETVRKDRRATRFMSEAPVRPSWHQGSKQIR